MKAKKGQILVFVLALMAIGLIMISPLLHYLGTSLNVYLRNLEENNAYYVADALMEEIIRDLYRGDDVYNSCLNGAYDDWSNESIVESKLEIGGFTVDLTINDSVTVPMPPGEEVDYVYLDPGVEFGLASLAHGAEYDFEVYLTGGIDIQTHWVFGDFGEMGNQVPCGWFDLGRKTCAYWPHGQIWIEKDGEGVVAGPINGTATSAAATAHLNYSVPDGEGGDYTITFKNDLSKRWSDINWWSCGCEDEVYCAVSTEAFSGAGESDHTWIKLGKDDGEGHISLYRDYTITATAIKGGEDILSITACIRQTPGPITWWLDQKINITSWQIEYY